MKLFFRPHKKIDHITKPKEKKVKAIANSQQKRIDCALREERQTIKKLDNGWGLRIYNASHGKQ